MKTLACIALVLGTLAAPASGFAQSNTPLTRAQVRADLVRVERAGYNPAPGNDPRYPSDIQAAEATVAAQQQAASGFGSAPADGTSASAFTRLRAQARRASARRASAIPISAADRTCRTPSSRGRPPGSPARMRGVRGSRPLSRTL
ncbi:exported hypothetical protein [Burkholderia vietnamiensis]|nr:exported hypothetical protein [Burkholderia vietnamiensis]